MLLRQHATSIWYELDTFGVKCVSQFPQNYVKTWISHTSTGMRWWTVAVVLHLCMFQKNQCRKNCDKLIEPNDVYRFESTCMRNSNNINEGKKSKDTYRSSNNENLLDCERIDEEHKI